MVVNIVSLEQLNDFIKYNKYVLIDFTATWCGPCKRIAPYYNSLEEKYNSILFTKVDVDDASDVAEFYNISSMPTFIMLENGKIINRFSGANTDDLLKMIENVTETLQDSESLCLNSDQNSYEITSDSEDSSVTYTEQIPFDIISDDENTLNDNSEDNKEDETNLLCEINTIEEYNEYVVQGKNHSNQYVIVEFTANWCMACKRLKPDIEKLSLEYKNQVTFLKVDVDKIPELAREYEVISLPTFIIFKTGSDTPYCNQIIGSKAYGNLSKKIKNLFNNYESCDEF